MNFATHTSAMVFYRKEHGLSQTEVARAMATTQSAVARLEKRLLTGADVTLSALQRFLLMKSKICGKWFVAKFPDKI